MSARIAALAAVLLLIALPARAEEPEVAAMPSSHSRATSACTAGESWSFGDAVSAEWRETLPESLRSRSVPVSGFSEALALRRMARSHETKALAEFFISRSLLRGGLQHIAYAGFATIASGRLLSESAGVQLAALDCLNQIRRRYPAMTRNPAVVSRIPDYLSAPSLQDERSRQVTLEYAVAVLFQQLGEGGTPS
jgi:hypothetical protein